MFRLAILVILGTAITAFVFFFIFVSFPLFPRGEYTVASHDDLQKPGPAMKRKEAA
jgi:hypothetical protein